MIKTYTVAVNLTPWLHAVHGKTDFSEYSASTRMLLTSGDPLFDIRLFMANNAASIAAYKLTKLRLVPCTNEVSTMQRLFADAILMEFDPILYAITRDLSYFVFLTSSTVSYTYPNLYLTEAISCLDYNTMHQLDLTVSSRSPQPNLQRDSFANSVKSY